MNRERPSSALREADREAESTTVEHGAKAVTSEDERNGGNHMSDLTLTNTVYIRTTAERLWQALTDADMTAKYAGGARVQSGWKPGDEIVISLPIAPRA